MGTISPEWAALPSFDLPGGDKRCSLEPPMFQRDGTKRNATLGSPSAFGSIDMLDYSIRRWAIADHPSKTTQSPMRTDAPLNELQRAIGRHLAAEYELVQPMPNRLIALLRKIEQPA